VLVVMAPPEALNDQPGIHGLRLVKALYLGADAIVAAAKGDGAVDPRKFRDRPLLPNRRLAREDPLQPEEGPVSTPPMTDAVMGPRTDPRHDRDPRRDRGREDRPAPGRPGLSDAAPATLAPGTDAGELTGRQALAGTAGPARPAYLTRPALPWGDTTSVHVL
jgi:hypothetical protein